MPSLHLENVKTNTRYKIMTDKHKYLIVAVEGQIRERVVRGSRGELSGLLEIYLQ